MKKQICSISLCAVMLLALTACTSSEETSTASEVSKAESTVSEGGKETIKTTKSSINMPLALETWGSCGKYCVATDSYEAVPVRITEIVRGDEASAKIKTFMQENNGYDYTEPEDGKEWVVALYEINLNDFTVDEAGTDKSVTVRVCGTDGGNLVLDDTEYYTTVLTLTDSTYVYIGTAEGMAAFMLPKGLTDYTVVFGEYNEQCAYFSGV